MSEPVRSHGVLGAMRRLIGRDAIEVDDGDPVVEPPVLPKSRPLAPAVSENDNSDPVYAAIEEALRAKGYIR